MHGEPDFTETRMSSRTVFHGKLLHVVQDVARMPDGRTAVREYIRHPGAAIIIALLDDETLLLERQFRHTFAKAALAKGVTGEVLLQMLERRLDNVVFRLGLSPSRSSARQLVRHGHIMINGRPVDIPSVQVKAGDEVTLREKSRKLVAVQASLEARKGQGVPEWMELHAEKAGGRILNIPTRASIPVPINEQLIVELYSK